MLLPVRFPIWEAHGNPLGLILVGFRVTTGAFINRSVAALEDLEEALE